MKLAKILLIAAAIAQTSTLSAETLNPRTIPQVAPMSPQEKQNLDRVLQWWREVVYAGHVELAPKVHGGQSHRAQPQYLNGPCGICRVGGETAHPDEPDPRQDGQPSGRDGRER